MDFVDLLHHGGIHRTLNAPQLRGKLENHPRVTGLRKIPLHNSQGNLVTRQSENALWIERRLFLNR